MARKGKVKITVRKGNSKPPVRPAIAPKRSGAPLHVQIVAEVKKKKDKSNG